jgi:D-alanine-D-alanine ligase
VKPLRILVLMHEDLVPPEDFKGHSDKEISLWKTEYDVMTALRQAGHAVRALGVQTDLGVIRTSLHEFKPHLAFNLLEEFHSVPTYDHHVTSYLELLRQRYTGCNPRGLMLARDKALSKKILSYHRIRVPEFVVFPRGRSVRPSSKLRYPLFVKSLTQEGSYGISQASVVTNDKKLRERVEYLHDQLLTSAIAEQYIEGRELYVSVLGNYRLTMLPVLELQFGSLAESGEPIATSRVKWDWAYQDKHGIGTGRAKDLPEEVHRRLARLGRRIYRLLNLTGYARLDFRLAPTGEVYCLEANPNPDLAYGGEVSEAAEAAGLSYAELLQRILKLGMGYQAEWRLA